MLENIILVIFLVLMGSILVFTPQLVQFRIKVLRAFHMNWFADWHERNINLVTIIIRSIVSLIILLLFYLYATGMLKV